MFRSGCIFVIAVMHFMPPGCLAECESCCMENVPTYMTCYKQCYRQCEPAVNCGSLNDPNNGNVVFNCTTKQCTANYTCKAGYEISGPLERTCLGNGSWSQSAPTCDPIECGDLSAPANGSIRIDCTTYLCTANFTCDENFVRNGTDQRTCQANGEWTLETSNCVPCPAAGYLYGAAGDNSTYSVYTPNEWNNLGTHNANNAVTFLLKRYRIAWNFKTNVADGVFFFAGPALGWFDDNINDFIGAFLSNGTFTHEIDNFVGHGSATVGSGLDDGAWHLATIIKNGDNIQACVDGQCTTGRSAASGGNAHLFPEFYIGGVPEDKRNLTNTELGISKNFEGCIKNLMVNRAPPLEPASQIRVSTCYECPDLTA